MIKILEKLKDLIRNGLQKIHTGISPSIKYAIAGVVLFFILCFFIYVFSWIYLFSGNTDEHSKILLIEEWRSFLTLLVSGSMIAAIITILKIVFVDNNSNGIPDVLENEENNNRRPQITPPFHENKELR